MKRMMMLLLLGLMISPLAAQELTGKWLNTETIDDDGITGEGRFVFDLQPDGQSDMTISAEATMDDKDLGLVTIVIDIRIPGTWTRNGDHLRVALKKRKATVDFDLKGLPDDFPDFLRNMMSNMLKKEFSKELLKEFDNENLFRIVRLSETELELEDLPESEEGPQLFRRIG